MEPLANHKFLRKGYQKKKNRTEISAFGGSSPRLAEIVFPASRARTCPTNKAMCSANLGGLILIFRYWPNPFKSSARLLTLTSKTLTWGIPWGGAVRFRGFRPMLRKSRVFYNDTPPSCRGWFYGCVSFSTRTERELGYSFSFYAS